MYNCEDRLIILRDRRFLTEKGKQVYLYILFDNTNLCINNSNHVYFGFKLCKTEEEALKYKMIF